MQRDSPDIVRSFALRLPVALALAILCSGWLGVSAAAAGTAHAFPSHELIVTFREHSPYWPPRATAAGLTADAVARASGGLLERDTLAERRNLKLLTYDDAASAAGALAALRTNPDVRAVEPNVGRELAWVPDDTSYAEQQWWLELIDAPEGWNMSTGVEATVVAVIDSGVSLTHPDLVERLVPGFNAVDDDGGPDDIDGHGTHVAGIIAAQANGSGTVGVAMDVRIMPIRVVDSAGEISVADEIEAIYWAVDNGADVINLSLGAEEYVQAEREAIQYAHGAGVVVVAAAGNAFNKVSYPGNYDEVIAAGTVKADGYPAAFTSRVTRVDVAAPGESIFSPGWDEFFGNYWDDIFYSDNTPVSGTSFSAAIVSGAAALLKSVDPGVGPEAIRALLKETATDTGGPGPESGAGAGQVSVEGALRASLAQETGATWRRTDEPVASGVVSRTWLWGEQPFQSAYEPYEEAQRGTRLVYYYDKSRMEVTNPHDDRAQQWYVTNGLLVVELVTGQLQIGDNRFEARTAAPVNIAGDPDDVSGPTYAAFSNVLNLPPIGANETILLTIDRAGRVNANSHLADYGVTGGPLVPETSHRVASVFWEYLNSVGPIASGGLLAEGPLFEPWFYATGYPITEAYWARVKVAGVVQDVLIQCFERRCLTYTPGNAPGWEVEMGNVGQHYYSWRYSTAQAAPPASPVAPTTHATRSQRQLWGLH